MVNSLPHHNQFLQCSTSLTVHNQCLLLFTMKNLAGLTLITVNGTRQRSPAPEEGLKQFRGMKNVIKTKLIGQVNLQAKHIMRHKSEKRLD